MTEANGGRILLTGGAGFIGTHLAERLRSDAPIVLFDNFRRNSLRWVPSLIQDRNVKQISGDVLDPASLDEAFQGVDTVIHLAAIAGVSSYYNEPLRTLRVNILGTVNVLDAAVKHKVKKFIDFSTSEVFGPEAKGMQETSLHGIGPASDQRWVYATSKLASEHFSLRYAEEYGFATTIVRPFNVYGPRQTGEGGISNFCRAAVDGRPLIVYGDGSAVRAWCYISDFVDGILSILRNPDAAGQIFHLGNPQEVETSLGVAERICKLWRGATIEFHPIGHAEVRERIPSIEKAHRMLGYEPKVDLNEGLQSTLKWFREGGQ